MQPLKNETIIDSHFSEPASQILSTLPPALLGSPYPVQTPVLDGVLSSSDFTARLSQLQLTASQIKAYYEIYRQAVARDLADRPEGPLAAGWSAAMELPDLVQGELTFPDQPGCWSKGELQTARQLSVPAQALDNQVATQQIPPTSFTPEVEVISPYGPGGPAGFTPWAAGSSQGIPLELWSSDDTPARTVYPTGEPGELTLRIGEVTSHFIMADPTMGNLTSDSGAILITTATPHGLSDGDEIDLQAHSISALSILGDLHDGDKAYLEFYPFGSVTPYGGDASSGVFKIVAKTSPAALHTETISGFAITVIEFAIGQDALESAYNAEDAINNAIVAAALTPAVQSALLDLVVVRNAHQLVFVSRGGANVGWNTTVGGAAWTLAHFDTGITSSQARMPYYATSWYDGTSMKGATRSVVRLAHRAPVVVVSPTQLRIPGSSSWPKIYNVMIQRVRRVGDDSSSVPNSLVRLLGGSGVDFESLTTNLVGAIKQCEAYQRYANDFVTGVGQFTFATSRSGDLLNTGVGVIHPLGVDLSGDPASFRVESLYWSVPAADQLDIAIPGALALRGDGPYHLLRRRGLKLLSASVGISFACLLDLSESATARAGLTVLGDTEVGAELCVRTAPVYTFSSGAWHATTTSAPQWMIRAYIRSSSRLESSSPVGQQSDQQVIYGNPMPLQQWNAASGNPFAAVSGATSPVQLKVDVLPAGERRLVLLQVSRTGGPCLLLSAYVYSTGMGVFGPSVKFCTPLLASDGKSPNSQTQRISFSGLRVSAPTGRWGAAWNSDGAEGVELMPYGAVALQRPGASDPRSVTLDQVVLPGQKLLGLEKRFAAASLGFSDIPADGSWLELTSGGHHFYVPFSSVAKPGAVLLPVSGTWTERITRLVDTLYSRLAGDANLAGLLEVSYQSLAAWGGGSVILQLRALRPGPHYNIRARLLLADRATPSAQQALRLTLEDYASAVVAAPSSISSDSEISVTSSAPGVLGVQTTFYEEQ